MLFEFAQANHDSIDKYTHSAYYGGGHPVPKMAIGNDYTLGLTYNEYAFKNWGNTSSYKYHYYDGNPTEVAREIVQPVKDKSPMYLHLSYDYPVKNNSKSYIWVSNFARDNYQYYNKDEVRYLAVVYKTNDVYYEMSNGIGHALRPFWAVDDADYSSSTVDISNLTTQWGWGNTKTGILVGREQRVPPSTDEWSYFIMDMKSNHVEKNSEGVYVDASYGIKANWGAETGDTNKRVAGIGMSMPICAEGEQIDISHIAYFSSRKEAEEYAKYAVDFNNDPGEYIHNTYTASYSTTNGPDDIPRVNSNAPVLNNSSIGMDFTLTGATNGYNNATYQTWDDSAYGFTLTPSNTSPKYVNVTCPDSYMDTGYVWLGGSDYASTNSAYATGGNQHIRYITMVYRTHGIDNPELGFWLEDYISANNIYEAGKTEDTFISIPKSSDKWVSVTYDLQDIDAIESFTNNVDTFNRIGIKFPGFTSASQSMDIAYIDFSNNETAATTFGTQAAAYMNGTAGDSGSPGGTTVTIPVEKPESSRNALDFTHGPGKGGFIDETYSTWSYDPYATYVGGLTKTPVTDNNGDTRYYTSVSSTDGLNEAIYTFLSGTEVEKAKARYVTMVYRTKGFTANKRVSFWVETNNYTNSDGVVGTLGANKYVGPYNNNIAYISSIYPDATQTFYRSENTWTFMTFDLNKLAQEDADYSKIHSFSGIGMYLPGLNTTEQLEIAAIDYYSSDDEATDFGTQMAQYMNRAIITTTTGGSDSTDGDVVVLPGKGSVSTTVTLKSTSSKGWNMGDNSAYGFLFTSSGGGWNADGVRGGNNAYPNGYYSYQVGHSITPAADYVQDTQIPAAFKALDPKIYMFNLSTSAEGGVVTTGYTDLKGVTRTSDGWTYDTSYLKTDGFDLGFDLHTTLVDGLATMGLVDHTLGPDKRPVYNDAAVDYIAYMLYETLRIPKTDTSGNYNYNFVKGSPSSLYGTVNGKPIDLATALRNQLKITFPAGQNKGSTTVAAPQYGDAAKMTAEKKASLVGSFDQCKGNIASFTDAAYYLLNNLYVGDSYNQAQNDYNYLILGKAKVTTNGKEAYVFDGGFTFKDENDNYVSAIDYNKQKNLITMNYADKNTPVKKDEVYFQGNSLTTRYPFLPVTDATGDFAGNTVTPYFMDDGARGRDLEGATYVDRNYNFAMAANGEFVYHYDDELFFQFEGDDDVYLFVNGELVLDIGAGHSITTVEMNMNEYIDASRNELAALYTKGYYDGISNADFQTLLAENGYTDAATVERLTRAHKLNLVDGQSYSFDFYYMERHGWGSNCRIATNIIITDPAMKTTKTAYQDHKEIEYAGVINPNLLTEYGFSIDNEGNSKLYNIAFKDGDIGVTIDPKQGLVVHGAPVIKTFQTTGESTAVTVKDMKGAFNLDGKAYFVTPEGTITWQEGTEIKSVASLNVSAGDHTIILYQTDPVITERVSLDQNATIYYGGNTLIAKVPGVRVCDAKGKTLDASDLQFTVTGYYDEEMTKPTGEIKIIIDDNEDLKGFLQTLQSDEGTQTGTENSLFAGDGLWRHATLSVRGIYYTLTDDQKAAQKFDNTVFTSANPSVTSTTLLKGQATHRVYTDAAIQYYQWAGQNLFVTSQRILDEAGPISKNDGSQLSEYKQFFESILIDNTYHLDLINTELCNQKGATQAYDYIKAGSDKQGNAGYFVNYPTAGTYNVYLLMYLKSANRANLKENEYAIVNININVASVADSTYVLDYGLTTAHLDANGELFKNDDLLAASGANAAKLMGITTTAPGYLDAKNVSGIDYNRIKFSHQNSNTFPVEDGHFTMTVDVGTSGKTISYNAITGKYSLTDVGTVKVSAKVPQTWKDAILYFWYDDMSSNGWPGTGMTKVAPGEFQLDIPADVTNVIISNSTGVQTVDLKMTPGMETLFTLKEETDSEGKLLADVSGSAKNAVIHVNVPSGFGSPYLYYWTDGSAAPEEWPGKAMTDQDSDGWYDLVVPGNVNRIIVNNNSGKQTWDVVVTAGKDAWVNVPGTINSEKNQYDAVVRYSQDNYSVHAKVPGNWSAAYLYYWYSDATPTGITWPGIAMTDTDKDSWYELDIPVGVTHVIVSNSNKTNDASFRQTVNLDVVEGADAWITVSSNTKEHDGINKHLGFVAQPGLSFTPTGFMDDHYSLYLAMTVHDVHSDPTALGNSIDIGKEVQMYKKVTVLPATVVYYEDNFPAINYVKETGSNVNVFEDLIIGNGGQDLTQDVDQDSEYGSDPTYDENADMSGNTIKKITIRKSGDIAYFTFKGTGFELISRTNADKYATINLSIYNASDVDQSTGKPNAGAKSLKYIPLVTEFDQGGDRGNEVIYQVPVIRVNDLMLGSYTVVISGSPSRDWDNWDPSSYDNTEASLPEIIDSYLYIDGLRVYQPLGASDNDYSDEENGATFAELRKLVVDGFSALAVYDGSTLTVGSGTNTWTEIRNPEDPETDITMDHTAVSKVEDYLIQGPNNEVYMNGTLQNAAIVLYVKEDTSESVKAHNLQIAVHAVDAGLFLGSDSTGMNADVYYGVKDDNGFAWKKLTTVTSGTEQYYTIDYTQCPKGSDGYYQVAVKTLNGMASFTSIKYNGLLLKSNVGNTTTVKFTNGLLTTWSPTANAWVEPANYEMPMFMSLRNQMLAAPLGSATEPDPIQPEEPTKTVTLNVTNATLSLEEETLVNIYFEGTNLENVDVKDMGLLTWSSDPAYSTYEKAENVYPGAVQGSDGVYMVRTGGIAAKNLADDLYVRVYAKLADGSYAYSQQLAYSPKTYAMNRLKNSTSDETKALCVALLNYGAAAQQYFGYKTDALMNADLTAEQQKLVEDYSSDMVTPVVKVDAAKAGEFAAAYGFSKKSATLSLEGIFAINYYFTPSCSVDGNVTFYYWTAEDFAAANVLTAENSTGTSSMSLTESGAYWAEVSGIAAKEFDEAVYVTAVYESDGVTYCTGVISYSLSTYFAGRVENGSASIKDLSAAAAVYGYYAKNYFAE